MDWSKLRVGIAWEEDASSLSPLAAVDNLKLYSVPVAEDWADTAALLANLDLVIAADTAVAHLAGAMGRPVWMLLPHEAHARWLDKITISPWYPTMRLFRQTVPGDWRPVIRQVVAALGELPGPHQQMLRIERKSSTALAEAALI